MRLGTVVSAVLVGCSLAACGSGTTNGSAAGGTSTNGGAANGGRASGGTQNGGGPAGGNGSGGSGFGGNGFGGNGSGGEATSGGAVTSGGRVGEGGAAPAQNGGSTSGGATSGGATSGGGTSHTQGGMLNTARGGASSAGGTMSGGTGSAAGGRAGGASGGGASTGSKFHVFLLLGQSNMAGYPKAQAADKVEDARIRVLGFDDCAETGRQKDKWDTAAPPLHECWNGAIGPGDYFAKTLLTSLPSGDTIGLVPCAISGEKIETFMKVGGSKYDWILQRAKLAVQAGGSIEGMLFHQGESNCGDSNWPNNVRTFVSDLRKDLSLGDVPFLAGELAYTGNCSQHNPIVNKLPGLISKAFVVSASGLKVDPADTQWNLHFDHDSQVTFGKRYAQKMVEALGL